MAAATKANVQGPPQHQVFITFRGEVRTGFVSFLQSALRQNGIKTIIDEDMPRGTPLTDLFRAIEESKIALVIFSPKYAESKWCLEELVKIVERRDEGKLVVFPIFYKVKVCDVKQVKGSFGHAFVKAHGDKGARPGRVAERARCRRVAKGNPPFDFPVNPVDRGKMTRPARADADTIQKWREALLSVSSVFVRVLGESKEADFVEEIVKDVKKVLDKERENAAPSTSSGQREKSQMLPCFGTQSRPNRLEENSNFLYGSYRTGLHWMPSIDQIILAQILCENLRHEYVSPNFARDIRTQSYWDGLDRLQRTLSANNTLEIRPTEREHEFLKSHSLESRKFFLDDMGAMNRMEFLPEGFDWRCERSRISDETSHKDDQITQNHIESYTERESQPMVNALNRYNEDPVLECQFTCLIGCKVPPWFSHKADGTILQLQLPPHWWDGKFAWLALCAVVSFRGYKDHTSSLSVKCICEIKSEGCYPIRFTCVIGGWGETNKKPHHVESDHVFVSYASCLHIRKLLEENQNFNRYTPSRASFEFFMEDGTSEVVGREVVKCGLKWVSAPDETYFSSWKANPDATSGKDNNIHFEAEPDATSEPGVISGTNVEFQSKAGNTGGCPTNDAKNPGGTSEEIRGNNVPNTTCLSFLSCWSMWCCCEAYEYIKSKIISWTERSPTLVEGKPSG